MNQTLSRWSAIANNRDLVQFVAGMFDRLAVHVRDRCEDLTVVHRGNAVELQPQADDAACDFGVSINATEADRLADEASHESLGDAERFRIMRALFTPATAAVLAKPAMGSRLVKWLTGAESVIHSRLISPTPDEPDATHTLIHTAGHWIVIPGVHGKPRRRYDLSVDAAAEYQRRVHRAFTRRSLAGWVEFGRWYRAWRRKVSTRLPRS